MVMQKFTMVNYECTCSLFPSGMNDRQLYFDDFIGQGSKRVNIYRRRSLTEFSNSPQEALSVTSCTVLHAEVAHHQCSD